MPPKIRPTEEDGKRSLVEHAAEKAFEARQVYGDGTPGLPLPALHALLEDRRFIRYPVRLLFDDAALQPGEFAHVEAADPRQPSQGFVLHVHPRFAGDEELLPLLVAYHLVCVNYGEIAGREAAEAFGSILVGMPVDDYYARLCLVADSLAAA